MSITRQVPTESAGEYHGAWSRLIVAAHERGAHAWRFRSATDPSLFIEFLEFKGGDDPRLDESFNRTLRALEVLSSGSEQEWVDASEPPNPR